MEWPQLTISTPSGQPTKSVISVPLTIKVWQGGQFCKLVKGLPAKSNVAIGRMYLSIYLNSLIRFNPKEAISRFGVSSNPSKDSKMSDT